MFNMSVSFGEFKQRCSFFCLIHYTVIVFSPEEVKLSSISWEKSFEKTQKKWFCVSETFIFFFSNPDKTNLLATPWEIPIPKLGTSDLITLQSHLTHFNPILTCKSLNPCFLWTCYTLKQPNSGSTYGVHNRFYFLLITPLGKTKFMTLSSRRSVSHFSHLQNKHTQSHSHIHRHTILPPSIDFIEAI